MAMYVYNGTVHHTAKAVLRAAYLSYSINKPVPECRGTRPVMQPVGASYLAATGRPLTCLGTL